MAGQNGTITSTEHGLQAYLLGTLDYDRASGFQRGLTYQVEGERQQTALMLCEYTPLITVGRQGSAEDIGLDAGELRVRGWSVRWVNRGGGCILHVPGRLIVHSIMALDHWGLGVDHYLDRMRNVIHDVLDDFQIGGRWSPDGSRLLVAGRPIAEIGIAIRHWVAYFGFVLNINPDLDHLRRVRSPGAAEGSPTSIERERRGPLRNALVRERVVEYYAARFRLERTSIFFDHPTLCRKARADALAARP